ncbi:MAG: dynein gamma chain protein [Coriobacteriia bacterium]|nr:dynein gamma chain protein [Coriobacteriia bacterium]MCL2751051.1 dynein gamma chain protein [Coriobacteriia bacterium]
MCTDGVNALQLSGTVEQIDEAVALCRRWTHRAYHSAADAQFAKTAASLEAAQGLLDQVRALLDEAGELVEKEAQAADAVTIKAV